MDTFFAPRRRQMPRLLLTIGLGAFLGFGSDGWAKPPVVDDDGAPAEAMGVAGPSFRKSLKPVRPTPSEAMGVDLANVPSVRLQAVDTEALLREDALGAREARVKILRYAIGRDLQVAIGDGNWYNLPDGKKLWAAEVVSTDALGVRLHFKGVRLPAGSELAVYGPSESDSSRGIAKSGFSRFDPDRYVEFYEASEANAKRGEFWTGTVFGDRVRIEYLAPAGAVAEGLPFAVDRLPPGVGGRGPGGLGDRHPPAWRRQRLLHRPAPQRRQGRGLHALLADRQPLPLERRRSGGRRVLLALPDRHVRRQPAVDPERAAVPGRIAGVHQRAVRLHAADGRGRAAQRPVLVRLDL